MEHSGEEYLDSSAEDSNTTGVEKYNKAPAKLNLHSVRLKNNWRCQAMLLGAHVFRED